MVDTRKKLIFVAAVSIFILAVVLVFVAGEERVVTHGGKNDFSESTEPDSVNLGKASKNTESVVAGAHLRYVTPTSDVRPTRKQVSRLSQRGKNEWPLPYSPWAATYRALEPLAENGNLQATKRLYQDTYRCLKYHALPTIITGETASFQIPGASSSAAAAAYASRLDRLSEDARQLTAMCKSTDSSTLKQVLPRVLENAAVLGVPGAGTCYVSGQLFGYSQSPEGQAFKPEYRRVAGQIIRDSLANGSWRMLHLLTHAEDEKSRFASSWATSLLGNDPKLLYALNRLELIGASGEEADAIQAKLTEFTVNRGLSQQDVAYLDQWAEQMYAKYFRDKPREGVSGGACQVQ